MMNINTHNQNAIPSAAKLMERLLERPVAASFDSQSLNEPFGSYRAGQEKGYEWGHEAGFGKGAAAGVLAMVGVGIIVGGYLWSRRKLQSDR